MPPSMTLRKNRSKRKKRRSSTHTDWRTLLSPNPLLKMMPHRQTHRLTTLSQRARWPLSMLHICDYYMILWEDGPYLYPPDLIVLQTELSLKGLDTNATTRTKHRKSVPRTYCKRLGLCRNVLGTICFDFIRITLSKDALRTLCDQVRSVFGRDERVRNGQGRTSNSNSIALHPRTSLVRSQYDSYVRNTTISFSVRWHYVFFQDGIAFQFFWVSSKFWEAISTKLVLTRPITFVNRSQ